MPHPRPTPPGRGAHPDRTRPPHGRRPCRCQLIEAGLLDPDGLKAAVTELETGPYREDPWSRLVEAITPDQAARAFLP
ncbi:MAG: hypothetical protein ACRDPY_25470 [Streptosporangiaceae bacterium]